MIGLDLNGAGVPLRRFFKTRQTAQRIGAVVVRFQGIGPNSKRMITALKGLLEAFELVKRGRPAVKRLCIGGPDCDRSVETFNRLCVSLKLLQPNAPIVVSLGIVRLDVESPLEACDRLSCRFMACKTAPQLCNATAWTGWSLIVRL